MNLLVIHETEYINKMIFEYQIIPEILASKNHNVFVMDYPTNWGNDNSSFLSTLKHKTLKDVSRANKAKGITLIRPGFIRLPVISRMSAFISYFSLIDETIKKNNIELIVLLSAPTNGLQALWAARKNNIPIYFRLLDVLHQLVPHKSLSFPTYLIEKFLYRHVDQVYAITPRLTNYAVEMGAKPEICQYLPSGADYDLFYYQPKDEDLLNSLGLSVHDRIILFAGTLYNFSGLDKIIERLPSWLTKVPSLKLLIVGAGEQEARLKELVQMHHLEGVVIFTGFINYPDLPKYINIADICINPFEVNKITNLIFPGKIYQYLACEKPVIASKLQGMLDIFPIGDQSSHIYYYETMDEFFHYVSTLENERFTDPNPSLQEIAKKLEQDIENALSVTVYPIGVAIK